MRNMLNDFLADWHLLVFVNIVLLGIWGVLVKIASSYLNPFTFAFVSITSAWIVIAFFTFAKLNLQSGAGVIIALFCGFLGGISAIIFYNAIKKAPSNIVIPLNSLYILVTVILSYFFLGEKLGFKKLAGILLGLASIVLLTI